jgi:hypothetical protein
VCSRSLGMFMWRSLGLAEDEGMHADQKKPGRFLRFTKRTLVYSGGRD